MSMLVKICGLKTRKMVDIAVMAGADMVGAVFFEKSPRNVSFEEAAEMFEHVPEHVGRVGLFVNPTDEQIDATLLEVPLDVIQLHGTESPLRVVEVQARFGLQVIKALPIGDEADVKKAKAYDGVADWLLFDAKAPADAERPGGNAQSFDWKLLRKTKWASPWILAGGLTPDNVAEAIALSGAQGVDVSSGVEKEPGVKDKSLVRAFLKAVKGEMEFY